MAKLLPKMKVIADDAYKRMAAVPLFEWGRHFDRGSMSSSFFSSTDPLSLKHKLDLTAAVTAALHETIGPDTKADLFFGDAKRLLSTCFDTVFYKSGFTFAVYSDTRPSDMKKDDGDDAAPIDSDQAVILHVALSTA